MDSGGIESTWSNIVSSGPRVSFWSKVFADFTLHDFTVDSGSVDEKFIQVASARPWRFPVSRGVPARITLPFPAAVSSVAVSVASSVTLPITITAVGHND